MEDYYLMPLGQIKFLIKISGSPDHTALASGKSEGGTVKELLKKGYIKPFGRVGRAVRWKLIKPLSQNEMKILKELNK